jgi:hypothetical protein
VAAKGKGKANCVHIMMMPCDCNKHLLAGGAVVVQKLKFLQPRVDVAESAASKLVCTLVLVQAMSLVLFWCWNRLSSAVEKSTPALNVRGCI